MCNGSMHFFADVKVLIPKSRFEAIGEIWRSFGHGATPVVCRGYPQSLMG